LLAGAGAACAGSKSGIDGADGKEVEMSEPSIEHANQVLTDSLIDLPGVSGVGIGECDGEPCLVVMVAEKTADLTELIPTSVDGFAVVVQETGAFRPLDDE
jgi:hypothetical protein